MTYDDLVCPKCGGKPVDVAPSFFVGIDDLLPTHLGVAVLWTCPEGHRHITGQRALTGQFEHMGVLP